MTRDARITCAVCAWRETCRKKFSVTSAQHCPEYTRDVTIKDPPEKASAEAEEQPEKEGSKAHEGSA